MLRVALFELKGTLVDERGRLFPHVAETLSALESVRAEDGARLRLLFLVDAAGAVSEWRRALGEARRFFEPIAERAVVINAPSDQGFAHASVRFGRNLSSLDECLLVTGGTAPPLRMKTLRLSRRDGVPEWSGVTQRIAAMAQGVEVDQLDAEDFAGVTYARGHVWEKVSIPGFSDLEGICIQLPVKVSVRVAPGRTVGVEVARPSPEDAAEAVSYIRSLARRGAIEGLGGSPLGGPKTHAIATDERGERRLVRRGFS